MVHEFTKYKNNDNISNCNSNSNLNPNFIFINRKECNQKVLLTPNKKNPFTFLKYSQSNANLKEREKPENLDLLKNDSQKKPSILQIKQRIAHINDSNQDQTAQLLRIFVKKNQKRRKDFGRMTVEEFPQIKYEDSKETNQKLKNIFSTNIKEFEEISLTNTKFHKFTKKIVQDNPKKEIYKNKNIVSIKKTNENENIQFSVNMNKPKRGEYDSLERNSLVTKVKDKGSIHLKSENKTLLKNKSKINFLINHQLGNLSKNKKRNIDTQNIFPSILQNHPSKDSKIEGWIDINASKTSIN